MCYNKAIMITPKEIIKSRRRSIALIINGQGELVVRAPYYANKIDVMNFVATKQGWIQKQQALVRAELMHFAPLEIKDNASLYIQGQKCFLALRGVSEAALWGDVLLVPFTCTRDDLRIFLCQELGKVLPQRVAYFAQLMGVCPTEVKLSKAKGKWGSCSYTNKLSFSWRLIFCPPEVLDYVVVHELSHITNKSHNKLFWERVGSILPHYREQEKWLKSKRKLMEIL